MNSTFRAVTTRRDSIQAQIMTWSSWYLNFLFLASMIFPPPSACPDHCQVLIWTEASESEPPRLCWAAHLIPRARPELRHRDNTSQPRLDVSRAGWSHLPHWPASWWSPQHGDHYQTIKTSTQTCNDPDWAVLVLHVLHVPRQSTSQRSTDIFPVIFNLFLIIMLKLRQLNLPSVRCNDMQKGVTRNRKQCVLLF